MKLLICSDIHGDLESAEKLFSAAEREGADRIVMLGDLLYHGPRNNLPAAYAPTGVIELLNENKDKILAVRGNCDTEVDQMVLDLPIMADYAILELDGLFIFATHGHRHNTKTPPPLKAGDILLHGHTHIAAIESFGEENTYINPGSAALPKDGDVGTYALYENRSFTIKTLCGKILLKREF